MKKIIPCDIRMDEGLRFRTDEDVIPCIVSHIHKDGGGQYSSLVMEKEIKYEPCDFRYDEGFRSRVDKDIAPTIPQHSQSAHEEFNPWYTEGVRIRKLTPRECWRLMGFDDEDFDKAKEVNSDTRLYSQAGNSIVVNVLSAIFSQML